MNKRHVVSALALGFFTFLAFGSCMNPELMMEIAEELD